MKGKLLAVLLIGIMIFAVGCGGGSSDGNNAAETGGEKKDEPIVLRVSHTLAPDSHYQAGLEKFEELVEQKTDGKIDVQIFGSAQLGSERDAIEGVSLGTLEMTLTSTAPLANFSKAFLVFDLPFIFTDRESAYKAMDGEVGQKMLKDLESKGIKGLGLWENGFRNLTNSVRPINKPEDVKGLKIRLMENPVHMATFQTLGANPTPMPFGELFTALQQQTVDGQENPLIIIDTSKFYEVQDHLAMTGHFYAPAALLMNKKLFDELDADLQKAIIEAADEAKKFERQFCIDKEKELLEKLKEKGMQVTFPDKEEFRKATMPVYEQFQDEIGKETIDAILNM
ncbi:MAG: TRAP-type transport system periplasmic protein [Clostridia bacterium]|nr:dicarboxylate transporter, DctP subunit [Clostridiales bacterium]MDK2985007.1 TRAP-type transport system periplasmic protein [Clostridia bacterium]